jgi:hypothetical protein
MWQRITISALILIGLASAPQPAEAQKESDVAETIARFEKGDPGMQAWFKEAYGYAVFPSVGKSTLTQVTVGLQLGGQAFSEVVFFKDKTALDDFTRGNFEMSAQVSAVALTAGASADLAYNGGVAVVTATKGGLMYEASVGGQKFDYEVIEP